ncbi:hypothetical protein IAR50_000549 [Cryptococcus sp. DSM 104548]
MRNLPELGRAPPRVRQWLVNYTPPGPLQFQFRPHFSISAHSGNELASGQIFLSFSDVPSASQKARPRGRSYQEKLIATFPQSRMVVKRDDSILPELLKALDDDLKAEARFLPGDWRKLQDSHDERCSSIINHVPPSSDLNVHAGLMSYFEFTAQPNVSVHVIVTELLNQLICATHINNRVWGIVTLFKICFVVKLTAPKEIRVSHMIRRDLSANASIFTNRTTDVSLTLLMATMARLGPLDPNHPIQVVFDRAVTGDDRRQGALAAASPQSPFAPESRLEVSKTGVHEIGVMAAMAEGRISQGPDGSLSHVISEESMIDVGGHEVTHIFKKDLGLGPPTDQFKKSSAMDAVNDIPLTLPPDFRLQQVMRKPPSSSPSGLDLISTLRFGKVIGHGALWDVYELLDAPGYVAKFCSPYGALYLRADHDDLGVEDIIKELETDTLLFQMLAPSGHAPVTHGLWQGFWVNVKDVTYGVDGSVNGGPMYSSIQETMENGNPWTDGATLRTRPDEFQCHIVTIH